MTREEEAGVLEMIRALPLDEQIRLKRLFKPDEEPSAAEPAAQRDEHTLSYYLSVWKAP